MSKGQVFFSDFIASIALFSVFLIFFGVIWNISVEMFLDDDRSDKMQHSYSFNLMKTSGYPEDWNSSNVEIPGFYSEGYLSAEKFLEFDDLSESRQRVLLKDQEFHIRLEDMNGSLIRWQGNNLSVSSDSGKSSVVPLNSTVYASGQESVLKETGERVELRYYTWQN